MWANETKPTGKHSRRVHRLILSFYSVAPLSAVTGARSLRHASACRRIMRCSAAAWRSPRTRVPALARTLVLNRHVALTALRAVNATWRFSLYIN